MPLYDGDGNEIPLSAVAPGSGYPVRDGQNNTIIQDASYDSSADTVRDGAGVEIPLSAVSGGYPVLDGEGNTIVTGGNAPQPFYPTDFNPLIFIDSEDSTIDNTAGEVSKVHNLAQDALHLIPNAIGPAFVTGTRQVNGLNAIDCGSGSQLQTDAANVLNPNTQDHTYLVCALVDDYNWRSYFTYGTNSKYELRSNPSSGVFLLDSDANGGAGTGVSAFYMGRSEPDTTPVIVGVRKNGTVIQTFGQGSEFTSEGPTVSLTDFAGPVQFFQNLNCAALNAFAIDSYMSDEDLNQLGNWVANRWGGSWTDF